MTLLWGSPALKCNQSHCPVTQRTVSLKQTIFRLSCFAKSFLVIAQAYTMELEAEVQKLKELNQELERKQVSSLVL
jgi:hypothetical protein